MIFEDDPTVVERDGLPYIEGRTVRRRPALVGADEHPALVSAGVELNPAQLNAQSSGEFVFAWLSFEEVDPDNLAIETVALDRVPAISDEQYGFVSDPPTSNRGGTPSVRVAFPREEVVETLGEGDHRVAVSGIVEKSTFQGSTELTIQKSGGGGGQGP